MSEASYSSVEILDTEDGDLDLPLTADQKLQASSHLDHLIDATTAAFDDATDVELQQLYPERGTGEVSKMGLWVGLIERAFALVGDTNEGLRREVETAGLLSRTTEEMAQIVGRVRERATEVRRLEVGFRALVEPVPLPNYSRYRSKDAWSGLQVMQDLLEQCDTKMRNLLAGGDGPISGSMDGSEI
ncbi:uncharacterized protein LAJ45_01068 [Morchella importuna]|uniref:uncharacterized protein n=1 Tax=Morchella importuna TaxID=1174673 RepID=UPI001E8DCA3A|nr:uncharacterized protein LAJ45_01068 [Morchella importuna]KAH8154540.1 hypothetical protein LAJ45_01068 [Morchella importuna]